jgi:hypothetical protein
MSLPCQEGALGRGKSKSIPRQSFRAMDALNRFEPNELCYVPILTGGPFFRPTVDQSHVQPGNAIWGYGSGSIGGVL